MKVELHPLREEDEEFVYQLFSCITTEQLFLQFIEPAEREKLLRMQYEARKNSYQMAYLNAEYSIIWLNDQRAGYYVADIGNIAVHLIDIAVLPEKRKKGICSILTERHQKKASEQGVPCFLHVFKMNPALALYERLGFQIVEDEGIQWLMKWPPG